MRILIIKNGGSNNYYYSVTDVVNQFSEVLTKGQRYILQHKVKKQEDKFFTTYILPDEKGHEYYMSDVILGFRIRANWPVNKNKSKSINDLLLILDNSHIIHDHLDRTWENRFPVMKTFEFFELKLIKL